MSVGCSVGGAVGDGVGGSEGGVDGLGDGGRVVGGSVVSLKDYPQVSPGVQLDGSLLAERIRRRRLRRLELRVWRALQGGRGLQRDGVVDA